MFLSVTGVSHEKAPIQLREQLARSGEELANALGRSRSRVSECVILTTCNRFELYTLQPTFQREAPGALLSALLNEVPAEIESHLYAYHGAAAASHLFRVTCGIESLILGEVQILGQVQRAWQASHKAGAAGPVLSQLFHRAVALGKRVHSETSISRQPASVSYAAVLLARRIFGPDLRHRQALVVGTGEVGEGVARCLHDYGVEATVVAHRQIERAQSLAARYRMEVASWDDLPVHLSEADIVISSTAAPHYILQHQHIVEAMAWREGRPLYLIDLALPRDIDPAAAGVPGVHLHNIDDLQAVVRTTLQERQSALPEIEAMIDREAARFSEWLVQRSTAPTIQEMQAQAAEIARNEIAWAANKLPDLTERERRVVEMMVSRVVGKVLHGPIEWVKAQSVSGTSSAGYPVGAGVSADGEPDYGIEALSPKELEELFYRTSVPGESEGDEIQAGEVR